MKRRQFDLEFKRKAVARVINGESGEAVATDLNISPSMVYTWKRKLKKLDRKVKKKKAPNKVASAIVLLQHAREAAIQQVTEDPTRFDDPVYGLAMMALRTLEGKSE
jgi:transposase-like protein